MNVSSKLPAGRSFVVATQQNTHDYSSIEKGVKKNTNYRRWYLVGYLVELDVRNILSGRKF
jgi:hypothetical protein